MCRYLLALILVATMSLTALAACGGESTQTTAPPAATGTTDAPQTTLAPTTTATQPPSYVTVDVQQTHERLEADPHAQIVDVREPGEWATTGVPVGSVLIPLGQLEQRALTELAKNRPVYVICNSGNRSRTGAEILIALGYGEVYNVDGGIQAWLRAGLPVEDYTQ